MLPAEPSPGNTDRRTATATDMRCKRHKETWSLGEFTLRRVRFVIEPRDTTLPHSEKGPEIEGRPIPPPVKRRSINPPPLRARLPERKNNPLAGWDVPRLYIPTNRREYAKFLDPRENSDPVRKQ